MTTLLRVLLALIPVVFIAIAMRGGRLADPINLVAVAAVALLGATFLGNADLARFARIGGWLLVPSAYGFAIFIAAGLTFFALATG